MTNTIHPALLLTAFLLGCGSTGSEGRAPDDGRESRSPVAESSVGESPAAESRFADAGDVRLEYFQFGDEGPTVVFVQDHHDDFRLEEAEAWAEFLARFSDRYRVLAPVRRGWGRSEDPGHGYDIETQATDVLGLLDALGIERAVFAGRTMATHEMLWIAENRPERVIALAFLNTPLLPLPDVESSPEMERFSRMYARTATDIGRGEEIDRRLERGDWRPRCLTDPDARIAVPALLTQHPVLDADGVSFTAMRLDRFENWSPEEAAKWAGDVDAEEYAEELRNDPARLERLRREAEDAAMNPRLRDALRRAFGDRLTILWESPREQGHDDFLDECERLLRPYFARVTGTGAED